MKTTFKLKVLTPMFMGGADPEGEPELRPASIRGAMRFWFRAIAGAVTNKPEDVYRLESEVFGNTERKSKVVVRVKTKLADRDWGQFKLLPHKNFTFPAISPTKTIRVEVIINKSSENYSDLVLYSFWLSTALGGWGRRSRRGAGTSVVQEILGSYDVENFRKFLDKSLTDQLDAIKKIFQDFLPALKNRKYSWPYLVSVKEWENVFENAWGNNSPIYAIFKKLSKFIRSNGKCLGQINPKRYASPIVMRVIEIDSGYTLRFSVLQAKDNYCEKKINEFFTILGNIREVWHV